MIALVVATMLLQEPTREDPGFTDIWNQYGSQFEAEGVTRPMGALAYTWTEGQYHLGLCRPYLKAEDVTHWRTWWDNTPLVASPMGRMLLQIGDTQYSEGLERAVTEPISSDHCQRIADSWIADMQRLAAAR